MCEYCENGKKIMTEEEVANSFCQIDKFRDMSVAIDSLDDGPLAFEVFSINYCPMCGKELKKKKAPSDNVMLRKLIAENPDLPLVFDVDNDDRCLECGSTIYEYSSCYISEVYFLEDKNFCEDEIHYYDDYDELLEDCIYHISGNEDNIKLSDEQLEEEARKYIEENVRHYKAIVVSVF